MQKLSGGIGDLKRLGFVRPNGKGEEQHVTRRLVLWKTAWVMVAFLLAWAVFYMVLSEILPTRPLLK